MSFQGTQNQINTFLLGRMDLGIRAIELLARTFPGGLQEIELELISAYQDNRLEMSEPYRLGVEDAFETLFKSKISASETRNKYMHAGPFLSTASTWISPGDKL